MKFFPILMMVIIGVVIIASVIIFVILKRKKNNKTSNLFIGLLEALGGKENITKLDQQGSRLTVYILDKKNVNKDEVKKHGVESVVLSKNKITVVAGIKNSVSMYNYLIEQVNLND